MSDLPTSFGGPQMAMSEYYQPDEGGPEDMDYEDEDNPMKNKNNRVPFHGNDKTMNMNQLILANVTNSPYFKTSLFQMKTFHEVIDEIYYKVDHLEPWERGTRKTAGMSQTGMCGGVRGVSAGGVVSSAFCLLFKLHTLRMSKKQMYTLLNHCDSPYIRALGFMYLRFTLPPGEIWKWFEPYLEDEEMVDIKAGGGKNMTMGEFCRLILTKMEWFETRFPRIAVIAEKEIREKLDEKFRKSRAPVQEQGRDSAARDEDRKSRGRSRSRSKDRSSKKKSRSRSKHKKRSRSRDRKRSRDRRRSRSRDKRSRSRDRSRSKKSKKEKKSKRSRSRDRRRSRDREGSFTDQLNKYKDLKKSRRSRSRS